MQKDINTNEENTPSCINIKEYDDLLPIKITELDKIKKECHHHIIDILNKYNRLKPGMYATIDVILDVKPDSKLIPVQCVLKDDKGNYVYTVNTDSTAVKKYIEIGDQQDNNYEIISGLTESDKFVSLGQQLCKDGGKVKIK